MAATNYTPIQLYFSTTASAVPLAANLAQGELAINITDGKLYYEDNAGVVQVIATKGAGTIGGSNTQIQYNNAGALAGNAAMTFNSATSTTTLTTLNLTNALGAIYGGTAQSTYAQGDVLYASASNTLAKLGIGAVNYILTSTGSVPQWSAPSSISVLTATNLAGGLAGSVPYQSAVDTTTFLAIGAANRVMTSTGTAPQWVTSLTGLTGVSSSSITNTSLTSGRVVVSTTGGAQADDADLTFDGTTLSAGGFSTVGLTNLVRTVKIGDSNFSGVAVFAPSTPAKLYLGTGTVTDTTSAIGATNATGAIASLAITPIAATNTSVTYTNAATLYIAGAPSAGTNVTLTNPYALYVNGGASYFGGGITLDGGTANGVLYLNGSKVVTSGSALTFDGTNFATTGSGTFSGLLSRIHAQGTDAYITNTTTGKANTVMGFNDSGSTNGQGIPTGYSYYGSLQTYPIGFTSSGYLTNSISSTNHIWNITGSEQMRLTSTGLGIGTSSPATKLQVVSDTPIRLNNAASTSQADLSFADSGATLKVENFFGTGSAITFGTNANGAGVLERMRLDSSGNLGLGVTPSAWTSGTYKAFQIFGGGAVSGSSGQVNFSQNFVGESGGEKYIATAAASSYSQVAGSHRWYNAPSGTAGNAITFTQAMTLDASGNLGVGTTSPGARVDVSGSGSNAVALIQATRSDLSITTAMGSDGGLSGGFIRTTTNHPLVFGTNNTERARIDSSGNLLVGTTTAGGRLTVATTTAVDATLTVKAEAANYASIINIEAQNDNGAIYNYIASNTTSVTQHWKISGGAATNTMAFSTGGTERARITSTGEFLVGTTVSPVATYNCFRESGADVQLLLERTGGGGGDGFGGIGGNLANALTVYSGDSGTLVGPRFNVTQGGSCFNTTGTYGTISDIKIKENIQDARGYLEDLCRVRIIKYSLKADAKSAPDKLGVIAQELEEIFPGMIYESPDVINGEEMAGTTTKNVKYSVFVPMLVKAMQEQQAIIESLKARLDAANL
jgi:hypothetical protein